MLFCYCQNSLQYDSAFYWHLYIALILYSVLTDLQKDTAFNIEDYPVNSKDYSLNVIQIAESIDKELYIYVYQPSGVFGSLVASSINISTNDLNFINYTLCILHISQDYFFLYYQEYD